MRLPDRIKAQLPPDYFGIGTWIETDVEYEGETFRVLAAFDVFRIIVAVQVGPDVSQVAVDYDRLAGAPTPQRMIERAVRQGMEGSWDATDDEIELEGLLDEDDKVIRLVGV